MKRVVSVSKTYKHRGSRRHRDSTKKYWFIYYYNDDGVFCTEQVSFAKAMYYKGNLWHRMKFVCPECLRGWIAIVKRKTEEMDCPYCR